MSTFLIYGKGKTGRSLAAMCDHIGQSYILCDESDAPENFDTIDTIIPSPGLPASHRVYQTEKILSELDFLSQFVPKGFQIHAITGTDGKSTTSHILYYFLKGGFPDTPVYLGGNFGTPLADILLQIQKNGEKEGHIVLEVSSFMAYNMTKFYVNNAILTNLHPDHLDWHRDISEYYNAKLNLLAHAKDCIIYPPSVLQALPSLPHFPVASLVISEGISTENNLVALTPEASIDISERQLLGEHNVANILCAATLAFRLGISVKTLSGIIPSIPALPHRLQKISSHDGKVWIDDSKSTTAQSLYAALRAFTPKKVYLIAGGKDKKDPFTELPKYLKEYCEECAAIGETTAVFLQACHEAFIPSTPFLTLEEAVQYLSEKTKEGDIILLSPGCSSFDMFENYEDRARRFVIAVQGATMSEITQVTTDEKIEKPVKKGGRKKKATPVVEK